MSQINAGCKTFKAASAIGKNIRVKLDNDGRVSIAGLAEKGIGTTTRAALAANDPVDVRLLTAPGTHKVTAIEGCAIGAVLYTEAAGKVQDTAASTAREWGIAFEAATADGDVIEAMPFSWGAAN